MRNFILNTRNVILRFSPFLVLAIVVIIISFTSIPIVVHAEELELLNRPTNTSGLTGLLVTTSPFSLDTGTIEIGTAIISENSNQPDFTLTEYVGLVSAGIGKSMEIALKTPFFHRTSPGTETQTGLGDMNVSVKWNFLKADPDATIRPAAAVFVMGILPTAVKDTGLNQVVNWGSRLGVSAGSEITWLDHILGIYADAQIAIQDLSKENARDRYQILNAGFIFPISKYRNLQLMIEYTLVSGKDVLNVEGANYNAFTYGLRVVSERLNLTIGTQLINKKLENYDDSSRIVGMLSAKF